MKKINESDIISSYREASDMQKDLYSAENKLFKKVAKNSEKIKGTLALYDSMMRLNVSDPEIYPLMSHKILGLIYQDLVPCENTKNTSAIRTLVNKHLLPSIGIEHPSRTIPINVPGSNFNYCDLAEISFTDCLDQINDISDSGQSRISVYFNDKGPILLRKISDESSAMLLIDADVDGIIVPKGTIVQVGSDMNQERTGIYDFPGHSSIFHFESYYSKDLSITPGRLSPWAHKPKSEYINFFSIFNARSTILCPERQSIIGSYNLQDFSKMSKKLLKLTGVKL